MNTNTTSATVTARYLEMLAIQNRVVAQLDLTPNDKCLAMLLVCVDQELELIAKELPF